MPISALHIDDPRAPFKAHEEAMRLEAQLSGERFYLTGRPCRRGHLSPRRVINTSCIACEPLLVSHSPVNIRIYQARWNSNNPEKIRALQRKWRINNKERRILRDRAWRAANPDKIKQQRSAYAAANRDKLCIKEHNRRAKKLAGGIHTAEEIKALASKQHFRCANPNCRTSIKRHRHIDHIIPLSRGGLNSISNIQLLCPSCNLRKSAKDPFVWAQQQGRLL